MEEKASLPMDIGSAYAAACRAHDDCRRAHAARLAKLPAGPAKDALLASFGLLNAVSALARRAAEDYGYASEPGNPASAALADSLRGCIADAAQCGKLEEAPWPKGSSGN